MAYIDTKDVKAIREALKAEFGKDFKFSVTREHFSSVRISVMSGVENFYDGSMDTTDKYNGRVTEFSGYEQINHYHTHYYGKHEALFTRISEIAHTAPGLAGGKQYFCEDDTMTDYFSRAYYVSINVGKWDKPYEINLEGQRRTLTIAA
jgi:hypothetical protein